MSQLFLGNDQGKFSQHRAPPLCGQPQLGAWQQNCEGCSSLHQCSPPLPNLECSTKICQSMNRWCHTLGATVRRCSFVESPSTLGTSSGAFADRMAIRTTCKSTKARRQHPATRPSARGLSITWFKSFGRILMLQSTTSFLQLLHITQAPFRLGIRESESYCAFDVHQRNEREHAWNVRLSL